MDLLIFFAAAMVAIVGLYLKIKLWKRFKALMLEQSRRKTARQVHIIPLIPKYQIAFALLSSVILAVEFMYFLLGFPLPKMEARAVLALASASSLSYLVWYSLRWRA